MTDIQLHNIFESNFRIFKNICSHICDDIVNNNIGNIKSTILIYLRYYNPKDEITNDFIATYLNDKILENISPKLIKECNTFLESKDVERLFGFIFTLLK
jgi:hypothetical protein